MIELIHGDCLEEMDYLDTESIDLVLTDPPYGTTACKWDSIIPLDSMWKQLNRVTKSNSAIVLCSSQPFTSVLVCSNLKQYRYEWIWEKSKAANFFKAKQMPLKYHENIIVFYGKLPIYNPQKIKGKPYYKGVEKRNQIETFGKLYKGSPIENKTGLRNPKTIQYFVTAELEGKFHPTQKPVALMSYLIRTYTNPGDTVLDFTMGSGTTGVACKLLNRNFIGIELDKEYFEIAKKRINETKTIDEELDEIS